MAIPVPDFGLKGLTGQELRDRINEILREGVAEGDSTTMDLLEEHLLEEQLKHDVYEDEDEDTRQAIDLFGRDEWERGVRPTILKSNVSMGTRTKQNQPSIVTKILLKLKLAKEVKK